MSTGQLDELRNEIIQHREDNERINGDHQNEKEKASKLQVDLETK